EPTLPEGEPGEDQPNNVYGGNGLIRPRLFGDAGAAPCAHGAALESGLSPQTAYQTWSIQSQGSRGYRFHMPVPAGWIWVPPSAPDVLAVFVPIDVFGPQITVRAQRVRWEVDVLAWLMHRCHAGGLAVTMARQQAGYEDARFEL